MLLTQCSLIKKNSDGSETENVAWVKSAKAKVGSEVDGWIVAKTYTTLERQSVSDRR